MIAELAQVLNQLHERVAPSATPIEHDTSVEAIVGQCAIAAGEDFNELWSTRRVSAGGTRERDSQLFVLGAAYGLAWAMNHLTLDGDGNVTMAVDDEGDAIPLQQLGEPDDDCQLSPEEP